jgi:hypothetical protein
VGAACRMDCERWPASSRGGHDDPLHTVTDSAAAAAHLRGMRVAATLVAGRVTHLAI